MSLLPFASLKLVRCHAQSLLPSSPYLLCLARRSLGEGGSRLNALHFSFLLLTFCFRPSAFIFLRFSSYFLLRNFSFFLLTFRLGIHQHAGIRSDDKRENLKKGGHRRVAAIIEGKIMNLSVETKVAIAVATSFVVLIVGAMAQG